MVVMKPAPEERAHEVLLRNGKTLATAESCTGGLLGDRITGVPGSSAYYLGGVIAYANSVKEQVLEVSKEMMVEHGAVSELTALEMARGARRLLNADYGISVTGIAGPGGGSEQKPVGLTWVAVSGPEGDFAARHIYPGDREQNKHAAVDSVLELLLRVIEPDNGEPIQVDTKRDKQDRLVPMAFSMGGNRHIIIDWGRRWNEDDSEHMLVRTQDSRTYEIAFDEHEATWRLVRKLRTPRGPSEVV
jgi:PncC family amidohydrolase